MGTIALTSFLTGMFLQLSISFLYLVFKQPKNAFLLGVPYIYSLFYFIIISLTFAYSIKTISFGLGILITNSIIFAVIIKSEKTRIL